MEASNLALVELIFSFAGVLGFVWWQLREVNRRIKARQEGRDPDAKG